MGEKSEKEYVEWLNDLLTLQWQSTPITVHICRLCQFKVTGNTITSGTSHVKQNDRLVQFRYAKKCYSEKTIDVSQISIFEKAKF